MALNTTSPTGFTTSVLIADTFPNDDIATMTTANGTVVSAALELQSTSGALLLPRLTAVQRDINTFIPNNGMILYNNTTDELNAYVGGAWEVLGNGDGNVVGPVDSVENNIAVFADDSGEVLDDSGVSLLLNIGENTLILSNPGYILGTLGGNTGVGVGVFRAITVGSGLTSMGALALSNVTSADSCCAFGLSSQENLTVGDDNSSFGTNSLSALINGSQNCAFGSDSLSSSTSNFNSAFGHAALGDQTTAQNNTAMGNNAGVGISTGGQNCIFGADALVLGGAASKNCALGYGGLAGLTSGDDNTSVGFSAGTLVASGFIGCTFLGSGATSTNVNLQNSTAIGFGAEINVSNSVNIGNACNVGINKNTPVYTLDIANVNNTSSIRLAQCVTPPAAPGAGNGYVLYCNAAGQLVALSGAGTSTTLGLV